MFDIAWSELLVIVVVAVVVVGPKDLPRLMRTAGQWAGRARAMADQFRRSFDDMARQSELEELRREVQKLKDTPLTAKEYEALGVLENPLPPASELQSQIEDVGAAPPKLDSPAPPAALAQSPLAHAHETPAQAHEPPPAQAETPAPPATQQQA
jgi:sec-independent protein translocase protein TatB